MPSPLTLSLGSTASFACDDVFAKFTIYGKSSKVLADTNTHRIARTERNSFHANGVFGPPNEKIAAYLHVFQQTYMSLKERSTHLPVDDGNSPPLHHTLKSHMKDSFPPLKIILSITRDCMVLIIVLLPTIMGVYQLNKKRNFLK